MTAKVIVLPLVTRLDIPVDRVLDNAALSGMQAVVILGYDEKGEFYFASSYADGGDVLWLLEKAKKELLSV